MLFGFRKVKGVVGIGLDGAPASLVRRLMAEGVMPNMARLAGEGTFKEIHSVLPTVSNVAWASFQTGCEPGEFGIFGFVDLKPNFDLFIPNASDIRCPTLWQRLDEAGKRYAALSVPQTWPAPRTSNFVVSGFLAPTLDERAVSNSKALARLRSTGYEIDIDPAVAVADPARFKTDLMRVARARQKTALALLEERRWDLFFVHVMDTDRLHHFMWGAQSEPDSEDGRFFYDFYRMVDDFVGRVADTTARDYGLLICSDHGFCDLKWEVQLNRWLRQEGYLEYEHAPQKGFRAIEAGSRALSLVPGRVHILRESRWESGGVSQSDYEPLRAELMDRLRALRHPDTGEVVCRQVLRREEVFEGPYAEHGPDIVIDPCNGYDLKAMLGAGHIFDTGPRSGMHTYDDAMLLVSDRLADVAPARSITEVGRLLAEHLL